MRYCQVENGGQCKVQHWVASEQHQQRASVGQQVDVKLGQVRF